MNPSKNPERISLEWELSADVVGRKHPNVGMLIELRLQLLLDGPVEVFVQDVGPPDVARRILHDRALPGPGHGCGDEDDRLAARPEQTQMHEQRRSDSVLRSALPAHSITSRNLLVNSRLSETAGAGPR